MAEADIQTERIRTEFEKFKIAFSNNPKHDPQPLMDILDGMPKYDIGVHMVYTIISVRRCSLGDVAGMQPFEFVKEYETCMVKRKLRPLFSATSEKGIIDYKRAVTELTALWKNKHMKTLLIGEIHPDAKQLRLMFFHQIIYKECFFSSPQ